MINITTVDDSEYHSTRKSIISLSGAYILISLSNLYSFKIIDLREFTLLGIRLTENAGILFDFSSLFVVSYLMTMYYHRLAIRAETTVNDDNYSEITKK